VVIVGDRVVQETVLAQIIRLVEDPGREGAISAW